MKIRVSKSYPNKMIFENFELEIPENKILCIMGESGVGKTTLLNILAGLVEFEGDIQPKIERTAYLFQTPRLLPHLTVRENLRYTAEEFVTEEDIEKMLTELGIEDCADRRASKLSGGEKQRVAMARAFLSSANLLLMDEPFSSLDLALRLRLISAFKKEWEKEKKTTVFVTHDLEEGLMLSDSIVVLQKNGLTKKFEVKKNTLEYGENSELRAQIVNALCEENN